MLKMLCYTFYIISKGVRVVKEKKNNNEQEKLKKKMRVLNDIFEGTALFGGIVTGFLVIALMMGGAAEITANLTMNERAKQVYSSAEFEAVASEGIALLDKKLAANQISEKEYKEGVDAIYSIPEVIKFAESANDEELSEFIDSYKESKELSEGVFTRGVPVFGSLAGISLAGAAVANNASKKARKKFEEAGGTFDVESSFDK